MCVYSLHHSTKQIKSKEEMESSRMKMVVFMLMMVVITVSGEGDCVTNCFDKCGENGYMCILECASSCPGNKPIAPSPSPVFGSGGADYEGEETYEELA